MLLEQEPRDLRELAVVMDVSNPTALGGFIHIQGEEGGLCAVSDAIHHLPALTEFITHNQIQERVPPCGFAVN